MVYPYKNKKYDGNAFSNMIEWEQIKNRKIYWFVLYLTH